MAYLTAQDGKLIYLSSLHTIGRLPNSVDTVINRPEVSRYHAAIEWNQSEWFLRDLSLNGTWVDQHKLKKDHPLKLSKGSEIKFGDSASESYVLCDDSQPVDILVSGTNAEQNPENVIFLNAYHLLPNDKSPEAAIFRKNGQWQVEDLTTSNNSARPLQNKDWIRISSQEWQVRLASCDAPTVPLSPSISLDDISLTFNLSLDEESTQLIVTTLNDVFNFQVRSHHYMTLLLARHRINDAAKNIDRSEQGWIYTDILAKELGLEENHLNIQIHRARKQFCEILGNNDTSGHLIQRRSGKIRLSCHSFKICKGDKLEYDSEVPDTSLYVAIG